jgi:predicted nucleic acid-binding protein
VNGFLLDTNVISELIKRKPEARVTSWVESVDERLLFLSVLTLGEIRKGISSLPASASRLKLETWLDNDLAARFSGRILAIDQAVADRWGSLSGRGVARGTPLPVIDALLAATAQHHELALVSRDVELLQEMGVSCLNPWK